MKVTKYEGRMDEHTQLNCHLRRFPNELGSAVMLVAHRAQQNNHPKVLTENKGKKRRDKMFGLFISVTSGKRDWFSKSCIENNISC